jgi:hypothetical protein
MVTSCFVFFFPCSTGNRQNDSKWRIFNSFARFQCTNVLHSSSAATVRSLRICFSLRFRSASYLHEIHRSQCAAITASSGTNRRSHLTETDAQERRANAGRFILRPDLPFSLHQTERAVFVICMFAKLPTMAQRRAQR